MQRSPFALPIRLPAMAAAFLLFFPVLLARAQNPPGVAAPTLKDSLMARAEMLYDSTTKSGLHAFDCQVHPDWNTIMTSSRQGAPLPADDPRLPLLSGVKITLHARLDGSSTLEWQPPANPLDPEARATLETAHRGIEQTLLGVLKLWAPLVNGSIPESFGEDDLDLAQIENGYTLRSKDKQHSLTEQFDRDLTLKQFITTESGSTIDIAPVFESTGLGLQLSGFTARIQAAGTSPQAAQQMRVDLEYKAGVNPTSAASGIPAKLAIEISKVVQMNFALDACIANPPSN